VSDPFLSPIDYDAAEQAAVEHATNRIIECCRPVTFATVGYPTSVRSMQGAYRFIDATHEGRTEVTFRDLIGALTDQEMSLLRAVAGKVAAMSSRIYGRRAVPRSTLLRAVAVVRQIDILFPDRQQIVLEIGGGSGYVGALLAQMGVRYISTDVTQAFYVVQNHVLNAVAGGRLIELATDSRTFFDFDSVPAGHAVHVPWWKFVVANPQPKFAVHLVTCNQALLEMQETALKYNCRLAHDLLAGDGLRCFLFEGWGNPIRTPIWQAARSISAAGLCFAYNDGLFPLLVRKDADEAKTAYPLPNAGNSEGEAAWHPPIFINPTSALTLQIKAGRAAIDQAGKHSVQDYDEMLKEVVGRDDLSTDDEKFLAYCVKESLPPAPASDEDRSPQQNRPSSSRRPAIARLFGIGASRD
jgi:hypothetical protein